MYAFEYGNEDGSVFVSLLDTAISENEKIIGELIMIEDIRKMYTGIVLARSAMDNKVATYCIDMLQKQGKTSISFTPLSVKGRYDGQTMEITHISVDRKGVLLCGVVGSDEEINISTIDEYGLLSLAQTVKDVSDCKTKTFVTFTMKPKGVVQKYAIYCENEKVAKGVLTRLHKANQMTREYYYIRQSVTGTPHKDALVTTAKEYWDYGMDSFK